MYNQTITKPPPLETIPLIISGPTTNRVDLVFFSDGYLVDERQKFIDDAMRLAQDVSQNQTFNTVQPLLNFWAAFSPSNQSGVGINEPKETPFGLYRPGTTLRGVYYAHPDVGRAACDSLGEQCDYPILLGNDPLYGGLGGEFTVITASILNGPLVLRHELGHSILDVGEEYDGGYAYFGRNAAHDRTDIAWKQWLSDPLRIDEHGNPRVERSNMAMQAYPWTLLNTTEPWSIGFTSSGAYSRYSVQFSLSGIPNEGDLRVTLDGTDLEWEPRTDIGMDRWFYNFNSSTGLQPGIHELKFDLLNAEHLGVAQLCSAEILEYGDETEFISDPDFYSLYPTYSENNETSYRPTNDDCLMRLVTTPNFCKVCLETLWIHLLRNISFIDKVEEHCESVSSTPLAGPSTLVKALSLNLLPLAEFRKSPIDSQESYTIVWKKDGDILPGFTNQTRIDLQNDPVGNYTVHVKFVTDEVRLDSPVMESEGHYKVTASCQEDI
ncbi:IgA peptidase M64-domain-containing protein [Gymnopilus junonius]|uniref:IgA peptidase M64-domain-containing protein n=1 Tax=Gymnopilus junonius TaxID=109634 RepID=A0A9P5THN4_GYMJU|nr:IgA peptidase M64-domain-containing protein [Gymnopilus junonius]